MFSMVWHLFLLLVLQLFISVVHLLLLQLFGLDSSWVGQLGYICLTVEMLLFFVPPEGLCLSQILALWNLSIRNFSIIDVVISNSNSNHRDGIAINTRITAGTIFQVVFTSCPSSINHLVCLFQVRVIFM
jgi:hypothetical protein